MRVIGRYCRDASEKRKNVSKNGRQPVMARLSDQFFTKQKLFQRGFAVTKLVELSKNGYRYSNNLNNVN